MSKQLGFYFEQDKCSGCKACQTACKDRMDLEVGYLPRTVTEHSGGGYFDHDGVIESDFYNYHTSMSCNHCLEPACAEVCPVGAIEKGDKGIVLTDLETCIGCGACIQACPYDAPVLVEEEEKAYKCDFCVDQIENGEDPQCVGACPLRALHYGDFDKLKKEYGDINQTPDMPEPTTEPALVVDPHRAIR